MPYTTFAGHRLYYEWFDHESSSHSQTVVLLNGLTMSTASWALIVPKLLKRYRVLTFDFLGQGQSDHPIAEYYPLEKQADLAANLLHTLQINHAYWIGFSYGGLVAQHLARRHPQVVQGVLLASTAAYLDAATRGLGTNWLAAYATGGADLAYSLNLPLLYSSHYLTAQAETLKAFKPLAHKIDMSALARLIYGANRHDARTWLHQLSCPCAILAGSEDRFIPLYLAEQLKSHLPQAPLTVLPQYGHALPLEAPDAFIQQIHHFVV